jgi:hypothetical protein
MTYRHTQPGTLLLLSSVLAGAVSAILAWRAGQWPPAIAVIVLVIVIAILFSSLTVEVGEGELRWYFGPGLWRYRLALADIRDVGIVRNRWWNGWGIRMGPGFRLYNVSGLDAVELRVGPDDVRRIGTDDPHGLAQALKAQRVA